MDETISNLVEEYRLELDYLSSTLGDIRQDVKDRFPVRYVSSTAYSKSSRSSAPRPRP